MAPWLLRAAGAGRHSSLLPVGDVEPWPPRPGRAPVLLPVGEAAQQMGYDVEYLIALVKGGLIEYERRGGELYVRPILLSTALRTK